MSPNNSARDLQRIVLDPSCFEDAAAAMRALEALGASVVQAADVRVAYSGAANELVIADAMLAPPPSRAPWIAVARSSNVQLERALQAGALDAVPRSVRPAELAARVERALRAVAAKRELDRLRARTDLARRVGDWMTWELDVASGALDCSSECALALGCTGDHAPSRLDDMRACMPADRRAEFDTWLAQVRDGATDGSFEHTLADSGDSRPIATHMAAAERDADGAPVRIHALVRVRSQAARGESGESAPRGMLDRDQLLTTLEHALRAAQRTNRHVAVLFVGVDRAKSAIASLSHRAAEDLSATIAERLRDGLRESDLVAQLDGAADGVRIARMRGDEFALVLPQLVRVPDAAKVGARLVDLLSQPIDVAGRELYVSVDVGIACYPDDHHDADELLRRAETAAYSARQDGHGTVKYYTQSMDSRAFERLTLETSLRRALERNELTLYYQPRVELRTQRIVGVEALVRWRHPDLGFIAPSQFIPLAEETGLIIPIGEWVLREACRQNRAWQSAGIAPIRMAVNLSTIQFRQAALHDVVKSVLAQTKLDARWLELELTESTLMQDSAAAVETLERLESSGVHLSIDDFGTGYSSLAYLKRFPIDALKIDRSFIRDATTNTDDAAIVTSIILMGRSLKLGVVAEGVETQSQLAFLRVLQCDEAQGYLFSPPVPAEELTRLLRDGLQMNVAAA